MSTRQPNEQSMTKSPGAGDERRIGVFRRAPAAAPAGSEPSQIQFTAPPTKKVSTQILALAGVLVLGGGLLYGMRLVGIGPLKNFALAKAPDYDMSQVGVNKTADHKRVLAELTANYVESQVPLENVQRNPFRMPDAMAKAETKPVPGEDPAKASEAQKTRLAEQRKQRIKDAAAQMKLNGVLGGSVPVARISGEAARVGDTVGEYFTVKAINGRSVELEAEGMTFTIDMHDDDKNATKRPGKK
jgi:hypothetical protein